MRKRRLCLVILCAVASTAAYTGSPQAQQLALAEPHFMSFDGNDISFAADTNQPMIGVRRGTDGIFEIIVPLPARDPVSQATMAWLGNASNMFFVQSAIKQAEASIAANPAMMARGGEIVAINEELDRILTDSGAYVEILALTTTSSGYVTNGDCSNIPICIGCQSYVCGQVGPWKKCNCYAWGQTCCVIQILN